jgi:hypothetical protein
METFKPWYIKRTVLHVCAISNLWSDKPSMSTMYSIYDDTEIEKVPKL